MKHARALAIALSSAPLLAGCGEVTSPARAAATPVTERAAPQVDLAMTPQAAAQAAAQQMLTLAEAGDWGAYVDDFYGEQHKFRPGENDRDLVVQILSKRSNQVIAGLRQVVEMQPTISEDGKKAVYDFGGGQAFTLFLTEDGRWTFHL